MAIETTTIHNPVDTITIGPLQTQLAATDVLATFQMPYDAYFIGASMSCGAVDYTTENETYVLTIAEGATTICTLTFPGDTAADTPVVGTPTASQQRVAKGATIKVTMTMGGTTPLLDLAFIAMSFTRA